MPDKTFTVTFTSKDPGNHPMRLEVGDHTLVEGEPYAGLSQEEVDRIKEDFGGKDGTLKFKVEEGDTTGSDKDTSTSAKTSGDSSGQPGSAASAPTQGAGSS